MSPVVPPGSHALRALRDRYSSLGRSGQNSKDEEFPIM